MEASIQLYLVFLGCCIALWVVGLVVYTLVTPVKEMALIAAGNRAAALTSAAASISIAAVIGATASVSTNVMELLRIGGLAVVGQLIAYVVIALILPAFRKGITEDKVSYGIFMAGISLGVALLNVGALLSLSG